MKSFAEQCSNEWFFFFQAMGRLTETPPACRQHIPYQQLAAFTILKWKLLVKVAMVTWELDCPHMVSIWTDCQVKTKRNTPYIGSVFTLFFYLISLIALYDKYFLTQFFNWFFATRLGQTVLWVSWWRWTFILLIRYGSTLWPHFYNWWRNRLRC